MFYNIATELEYCILKTNSITVSENYDWLMVFQVIKKINSVLQIRVFQLAGKCMAEF